MYMFHTILNYKLLKMFSLYMYIRLILLKSVKKMYCY